MGRSRQTLQRLGGTRRGAIDLRLERRQFLRVALPERAAEVAGIDAFEDACQLPEGERDVEVEVAEIDAGDLAVALGEIASIEESRNRARRAGPRTRIVCRAGPVHHQHAEVGEAVAERADLPVEHGGNVAVPRDDAVVEPVVTVHHRGRPLRRNALQKTGVHIVDGGQLARLLRVPLPIPTTKLASDVILVLAEIVQSRLDEINTVNRGHRVDDRFGAPRARCRSEHARGRRRVANDVAIDEAHDVEGCPVDGRVVAEAEGRRHRHIRRLQTGDDAELAAHVVRARQHVTERWTPQHVRLVVRSAHGVREVRVAAGDDFERERALRAFDRRLEPGADRCDVDAVNPIHCFPTVSPRAARSLAPVEALSSPVSAPARAGILRVMAIDVTDATFQTEVIDRSKTTPVVVDLWAPWCGPCRTIGPILEKVTDATNGEVVLVKVNVDENPGVSQAFQVKSIPAVYALKDGQVVDGFVGAYPEQVIEQFVATLRPSEEENLLAKLIEAGDETSLTEALLIEPGNEDAVIKLAELFVASDRNDEALALLARIPESERTRKVAASARVSVVPDDDYDATLTALLERVKTDDEARQQFVDILELMGNDDPRTAGYRKQLTARLF